MTMPLDTPVRRGEDGSGRRANRELGRFGGADRLEWLRCAEGVPNEADQPPELLGGFLTKVIEREIIPRLFLAHRGPFPRLTPDPKIGATIDVRDSEHFTDLVLRQEPSALLDHIQAFIDRGVALERIYLDLLAPVALRLGQMWEDDRCTFTDVTLGLSRLQLVLREIGRRNGTIAARTHARRRVCLFPAPGEQHTFGMSMVEEHFLHAGWETASDQAATAASIVHTVSTRHLDIMGFSVGCDEYFGPLPDLIKHVCQRALNPGMAVMVGGRFVTEHPEIASALPGATLVLEGMKAVDTAELMLSRAAPQATIQNPL